MNQTLFRWSGGYQLEIISATSERVWSTVYTYALFVLKKLTDFVNC